MKPWMHALPDPTKSWYEMEDLTVLTVAVWAEARGQSFSAKLAVAWTIRNRAMHPTWWGVGWKGVILKPKQFSPFSPTDRQNHKLKNPLMHGTEREWADSYMAAAIAYYGGGEDASNGADHFYSGDNEPGWSVGREPVLGVDGFKFYRLYLPGEGHA